ncbi:MAG: M3 family metallopeptidase [Patescibacteria group bacterium]
MKTNSTEIYLDKLNREYLKLHQDYEKLFWVTYMGDHSFDKQRDLALSKRDKFRVDEGYSLKLKSLLKDANKETVERIKVWLKFFECYQSPKEAASLKGKIDQLESKILKNRSKRKEGYIGPYTKKFVKASSLKMSTMMRTHDDEKVRKACFEARENLARFDLNDYVKLVSLRNEYARKLGYADFYDFKVQRVDGMTKKELFGLFDSIYQKTKYAFADIRNLEKKMPGLRKPWNFGFMMAGNFTKEEDPYFQFEEAVERWGRSFAALGVDFQGATLRLDLVDREGKYNNGFCHWPVLTHYKNGKRMPGESNFTCNVVPGQIGAGHQGYHTLFHEGGHAAHLLNAEEREVVLNHEYPPSTASWDETQSMFMDTIFSSIEWKHRYAKDAKGNPYPLELFERKVRKLAPLMPMGLNGIIFVSTYEKEIYETKKLDVSTVLKIAKKNFKKYYDRSVDSIYALDIPHIYSWESSGAYHGYGLAELALSQWREYFYKKYGYVVDNPKVGEEMARVWKLGARKTFKEFVEVATGKELSSEAFLRAVTMPVPVLLKKAKERIARLEKVRPHKGEINLNVKVYMVHGKKEIANNKKSFKKMTEQYKAWLRKQ